MNREILFRGKRVDNGEWIYGSLLKLTTGYYISLENNYYNEIDVDLGEKLTINALWEDNDFYAIHIETIGQYTGLCDKEGNKIFEGDIFELKSPDKILYLVEWHDTGFMARQYSKFRNKYVKTGSWVGLLGYCKGHMKKVGNIHDNPELLKEKK